MTRMLHWTAPPRAQGNRSKVDKLPTRSVYNEETNRSMWHQGTVAHLSRGTRLLFACGIARMVSISHQMQIET